MATKQVRMLLLMLAVQGVCMYRCIEVCRGIVELLSAGGRDTYCVGLSGGAETSVRVDGCVMEASWLQQLQVCAV